MNFHQWLKAEGIKCPGELTPKAALALSEPLTDPGSPPMKRIGRIVVHHSATRTGSAAFFRVLHRGLNRWNDIGYHFVIGNGTLTGDGTVEKGRALPFTGAHAKGGNTDSVGICLVGNFNETDPTPEQMQSLGNLLHKLMDRYGIGREGITVHRNVKGSSTECPGSRLTLAEILKLIDD